MASQQPDLLKNLNPMQREAVLHVNGPLLLFAGAGSGKTRTLTYRIAYMIQQGVNPFHILAITFTNKAAREMRARVDAIAGEVLSGETGSAGGSAVWVSTFHSFCVRILRREIERLHFDPRFTIYDDDDSERLIRDCLKALNVSDKQYPVRGVMAGISHFKNELLTPEDAEREHAWDFRQKTICEIYRLYQSRLRANNALDFDDLIFATVRLFTAHEDVLRRYQDRFQYIMVDEYQDTNMAQYTLVKRLADRHKNLCVVGDDDQSIYGWRGADIRNILEFEQDYPQTRVIKLEQNYRSTKTILDAANAVIDNNVARKAKTLWTENGQGGGIQVYKAGTDLEEGAYIADKIMAAVARGARYGDFAVLYRNNAQSRIIEDVFVKRGVPYRLLGGVRFYERREVRDVMAYLKFLNNPHDTVALMRIINVPRRGIGDVTLDRISAYAAGAGISFFMALYELEKIDGLGNRAAKLGVFRDLMENLLETALNGTAAEVVAHVLLATGYKEELLAEGTDESRDRLDNIDQLLAKAMEFEGEDKSLAAFLDEVALVADVDGYNENDDAAVMMTLHSSKGLEFRNVFIAGFEEGIFPSYRSVTSSDREGLEEERRLCYVGMTRAREGLVITCANSRLQHGMVVYNAPSRFLREIPQRLMAGFGQPKPVRAAAPAPKPHRVAEPAALSVRPGLALAFAVGDRVRQQKYGEGVVTDIRPAGADFEVAVEFPGIGVKKFMAHLSRLSRVE